MRVTVVPSDRLIMVDGYAWHPEAWGFEDADIHAIQWYGESGEIEYEGSVKANQVFTDESVIEPYYSAYTAYVASLPPAPGPGDTQYWEGAWTSVPTGVSLNNTVGQIKYESQISSKVEANNLLSATDWMVVRSAESGEPIPEDVAAWRAEVRRISGVREEEIEALTTKTEIVAWWGGEGTQYPEAVR